MAGGLIRVPTLVSGYRTTPESAAWIAAAQGTLAVVTLVLAPPVHRYLSARTATGVMAIALVAATILCGALIVGVPDPQIDLFYVLNEAPRQLLAGHNPYAGTYQLPQGFGFRPQYFGYLPGMALLSLPGRGHRRHSLALVTHGPPLGHLSARAGQKRRRQQAAR